MARSLFTSTEGPAPQRSRLYPYGFPWLTQQGKIAADTVTINAVVIFVLAFAAMTQKNTEVVLTTSQERGEPRRGEPCSWWQASEAKHLATMGATRGTVYTCGLARRWKQSHATRPGPMGVMTKFPCSDNLSTGWPSFNGTKEEHTGPLSSQCSCGKNHKSGLQEPTKKTATHAATCATTSSRKWSTEQVEGAWQWRALFLHSGRCRQPDKLPTETAAMAAGAVPRTARRTKHEKSPR